MTCLECRDLMLEVARRRAAPFVDRSVLAHAADCEACRTRLEQERALTAALGQMARDDGAATASAEVEQRLMAAFAAQAATAETPARASRGLASRWLPAAAALLLAAGGAAWWGLRPAPVAPLASPVAQASPAAPLATAPPASAQLAGQTPAGEILAMDRPRPARRAPKAAPPKPPIEAVGFVAIPSAAGLPDFESGEIVRLGIPVTALPNYGVDIPAGGPASIQADLLIGQDGQARAIRLVTASVDLPRPRH